MRYGDLDFGYDKDNRCNCISRVKITDLQYDSMIMKLKECLEKSGLGGMYDYNMIMKSITTKCKQNIFMIAKEARAKKAAEKAAEKEAKKAEKEAKKAEKEAKKANLMNLMYDFVKANYGKQLEWNDTKKVIYFQGNPLLKNNIYWIKLENEAKQEIGEYTNIKRIISCVVEDIAKEKKFVDKTIVSKDNDNDFDLLNGVDPDNWEQYLQDDEKGNLKSTIFNYMLFLSYHPQFKDKIKMNLFDKIEYLVRYDNSFGEVTNKPIDDYEADLMKSYIEKYFNTCVRSTFDTALNNVLLHNSYHPLKEQLYALKYKWDGKKRVHNMMVKYFDCPDNEYVHEMTEIMMCGAYQRIIEERPDAGCPFDYMGVIIGKQGTGKTKFFTKLFGDKYTVINPDVKNDQSFTDLTNRAWLVLFDEMSAIEKADLPTVKSRITEQGCNVRLSYGRRSKYFPRHSVFWGNTNTENIFRDEGYERRFLCFESNANPKSTEWWNENFTQYDIDQIWAETMQLYYEKWEGKIIYVSQETQTYNQMVQARHKIWNSDSRTKLEIEAIFNQKYEKMVYFAQDYRQFLKENDINHNIFNKNCQDNVGFDLKIIKKEWILSRFNRKNEWIDGIVKSLGWSEIDIDDDFLGKGKFYLRENCDYASIRKEYEESFDNNNSLFSNTLSTNEIMFFG